MHDYGVKTHATVYITSRKTSDLKKIGGDTLQNCNCLDLPRILPVRYVSYRHPNSVRHAFPRELFNSENFDKSMATIFT